MFRIHLKLATMALFWASSYPLGRWLAPYDAPVAIVVFRTAIAFVFLAIIAAQRGELAIRVTRSEAAQLLTLGIAGFCIHNLLMFEALEHTQANTGAVINGAIPVAVMVLDYLVFRRRLARLSVLGVAVSFAGTAIVVSHGDLGSLLAGRLGYGEGLFLLAITGWALYSIVARPLLDRHPPVAVTAYACLSGTLLLLPLLVAELDAVRAMMSEPRIVLVMFVQGLLTIGLGFLWYYEGVKAIGPMNAAVYVNLVPVFGVVLAAATLGEIPDGALLAGGALVVGGLLVVNRAEARRLSASTLASA